MVSSIPPGEVNIYERYVEVKDWAKKNCSFDQLVHLYAKARLEADLNASLVTVFEARDAEIGPIQSRLDELQESSRRDLTETVKSLKQLNKEVLAVGIQTGIKTMQLKASKRGSNAAEIRHGKPGGTRSKAEQIKSLWTSGKYKSRDVCAEQECAALNMSYASARKALIGTPDPT